MLFELDRTLFFFIVIIVYTSILSFFLWFQGIYQGGKLGFSIDI